MPSKASVVFVGLLAGAVSLPSSFAAANSLGAAGGINARAGAAVHRAADSKAAQRQKAAALKSKKQQQAAAAARARKAQQAKALQGREPQQPKKKWYEDDRDRGLDIAEKYAPKTIARVREKNYVAKGDTVSTGGGKKGWQHYVDKYYAR